MPEQDSPYTLNTGTSQKSYLCPPEGAAESEKLAWFKRTLNEGDAMLRTQSAYQYIPKAISIIMGDQEEVIPEGRSNVQVNFQKRIIYEVIANLSNTRPISGFDTFNHEWDNQSDILNKLSINHYYNNNVDRTFKRWLQWAAISTGWLMPIWKRDYGKYGQGDICFEVRGPLDCTVTQMPADMNYQQAYTFAIRSETPLHLAWDMWGAVNPEAIVSDRDRPSWWRNPIQTLRYYASPLLNSVANKDAQRSPHYQTCDIFDVYIMDMSVNDSGQELKLGDWDGEKPRNSWSYRVPFKGQQLPTGMKVPTGRRDQNGAEEYVDLARPAENKDCLLYPNRRLITATRHGILYDGPSYWWHGKVPAVRLALDDWFEFLGIPLTKDGGLLQRAVNEILRGVVDMVNVSLDPPVTYVEGAVAKADVKKLSLRQRGVRLPKNGMFGKVFETMIDASYYQISAAVPVVMAKMQEWMEYLLDVNNIKALALRSQVPASDTVESLNMIAGAITTDRSRTMEAACEQIYEIVGSLIFQFYNAKRRLKEVGPQGSAKEDFNYDPDNLLPANQGDNEETRLKRARDHYRNFSFHLENGSLHDMTSQAQRIGMLTLKRSGGLISWNTILKMFEVPNVGTLSGDPQTETDKYIAEAKMIAELMQSLQPPAPTGGGDGANLPPEVTAMIAQLQAAGGGAGSHPGQTGRQASGQQPAHIVQKSNGDATVSESR